MGYPFGFGEAGNEAGWTYTLRTFKTNNSNYGTPGWLDGVYSFYRNGYWCELSASVANNWNSVGVTFYGEASGYAAETNISLYQIPMRSGQLDTAIHTGAAVSSATADFSIIGLTGTKTVRHYTGSHQDFTEETQTFPLTAKLAMFGLNYNSDGTVEFQVLCSDDPAFAISNGMLQAVTFTKGAKAYLDIGRGCDAVFFVPYFAEFDVSIDSLPGLEALAGLFEANYSNTIPAGAIQPNIVGDVSVMNVTWDSVSCSGGAVKCAPASINLPATARNNYGKIPAGFR